MDYTSIFVELLKLSPFVATLFFFLFTVWKSMQKKDDALMSTMREHASTMMQVQEKSILAQNNAADANRQLSGSITKLGEGQTELLKEVKDLRRNRINGNRVKSTTPPATA